MNKNNRLGVYKTHVISGETYQTYVPSPLPPHPAIDSTKIQSNLDRAQQALALLNATAATIPNISLFIYMYVRKEALLSSQIEGTQSSFSDLILFENNQKPLVAIDDVEEVSNYVNTINYGLEQMRNGMPLSLRLIKEMHGILLQGTRGKNKLPGQFRTSQNWIGGSRPSNALFVPPAPEDLINCLSDFETFLHTKKNALPVLITIGLAHVQFETIHPFLDGNGRLGRTLITLLLCHHGLINEPILYLSLYLKQNRFIYYTMLDRVRTQGEWEVWLEFFLDGIYLTATKAVLTANKINLLFAADEAVINTMGRIKTSAINIFTILKKLPQLSVPVLVTNYHFHPSTARDALTALNNAGIISEITGKKRDRVYVYKKYLALLDDE